jgi:class 3 adenylate cyclase
VLAKVVTAAALAQSLSPTTVVEALKAFRRVVSTCATREGGSVDRIGAHAAIALFGVPAPQGDEADRCLRMALACRDSLLTVASSYPALDFAVAVSAGSAVVEVAEGPHEPTYGAVGFPVEQAIQLISAATLRSERVLASEEAVDRAKAESRRWIVAAELSLGEEIPVLTYEPKPSR